MFRIEGFQGIGEAPTARASLALRFLQALYNTLRAMEDQLSKMAEFDAVGVDSTTYETRANSLRAILVEGLTNLSRMSAQATSLGWARFVAEHLAPQISTDIAAGFSPLARVVASLKASPELPWTNYQPGRADKGLMFGQDQQFNDFAVIWPAIVKFAEYAGKPMEDQWVTGLNSAAADLAANLSSTDEAWIARANIAISGINALAFTLANASSKAQQTFAKVKTQTTAAKASRTAAKAATAGEPVPDQVGPLMVDGNMVPHTSMAPWIFLGSAVLVGVLLFSRRS
jgi:hypothetical protein